jgi:hypothetical protein
MAERSFGFSFGVTTDLLFFFFHQRRTDIPRRKRVNDGCDYGLLGETDFLLNTKRIIYMYEYEKVHGIQTYYCKRAFKTSSDAADDASTQHQWPLATTAAIG